MTTLVPTTVATSTATPTTLATTAPPTTVAPTTLWSAPTTTVPGTTATTLAPVTAAPGPEVTVIMNANQNLIIYVDSLEIEISIHGDVLNKVVIVDPLEVEIELVGSYAQDVFVVVDPLEIEISLHIAGVVAELRKCNWVAWAKIGDLDFTVDRDNLAGSRPMDWKGCVYKILKLGSDKVVVYGENGVTIMAAHGNAYGMQTIHTIGVVHRTAIAGSDFEHYFIDRTNKLYKMSAEGLQILDYSEYLALLTEPTMSLDVLTGILYICDNEYGFVYSTKTGSFGSGPVNITGIGSQSSTFYVVAPAVIETPKFDICTDIYDLGTRKPKTIQWVEVGTNLASALQAMIESRVSNKADFIESRWVLVNPSGIAHLPCYGLEFKFHLRSYIYEYFELDYIKVMGVIHGASYLDQQ